MLGEYSCFRKYFTWIDYSIFDPYIYTSSIYKLALLPTSSTTCFNKYYLYSGPLTSSQLLHSTFVIDLFLISLIWMDLHFLCWQLFQFPPQHNCGHCTALDNTPIFSHLSLWALYNIVLTINDQLVPRSFVAFKRNLRIPLVHHSC